MPAIGWTSRALVIVACLAAAAPAARPEPVTPWPLIGTGDDHPLLANFEYMEKSSGDDYIHAGLDIPAVPWQDDFGDVDLNAQDIAATVEGTPFFYYANANGVGYDLHVQGTDNRIYIFAHITPIEPLVAEALGDGAAIPAGTVISQVERWDVLCATPTYHHLHYQIHDDAGNLDSPLMDVTPFSDEHAPMVHDLLLCPNGTNCDVDSGFKPTSAGACVVVTDDVDILAKVSDRHRPNGLARPGDAIAPRHIAYRACPATQPICAWHEELHDFAEMPTSWSTGNTEIEALYSMTGTISSKADYCTDDTFWLVPTNVDATGDLDGSHSWDTATIASSTGQTAEERHYTVSVRAVDFGGNEGVDRVPVCIGDASGCGFGKLLVRDCEEDDGAEPSPCENWTSSPDIDLLAIVQPDETVDVNVDVCIRNAGCGSIDSMQRVLVELQWAPMVASVPGSTLASKSVRARDMNARPGDALFVPVVPWPPGQDRCVDMTLSLPPDAQTRLASGNFSIEAVVSMTGDPAHPTAAIRVDNNRAMLSEQTFAIVISPIYRSFWLERDWYPELPEHEFPFRPTIPTYPLPPIPDKSDLMVGPTIPRPEVPEWWDRRVEIEFDARGIDLLELRAQILVGPDIRVGLPVGGAIVGAMRDAFRKEWSRGAPFTGLERLSADDARTSACLPEGVGSGREACWQVIDGFPLDGKVTLYGVQLKQRAPIELHVWRSSPSLDRRQEARKAGYAAGSRDAADDRRPLDRIAGTLDVTIRAFAGPEASGADAEIAARTVRFAIPDSDPR